MALSRLGKLLEIVGLEVTKEGIRTESWRESAPGVRSRNTETAGVLQCFPLIVHSSRTKLRTYR